jgi:hypothetical protein
MKTETPKYTSLEQEVIVCIKIHGEEYENNDGEYQPVMTSETINEITDIPMKKLRGVLSSLYQKNVIIEDEFPEVMVWRLIL